MASELWVRDGSGTPRKLTELWIRDAGGVARLIKELWARDAGGVARKIFQYFTIYAANMTSEITGTPTQPQIRLQTDGTALVRDSTGALISTDPWGTPTTAGIGSQFWIIVTLGSGSGVIAGSLGSPGSPVSLSSEYVLTMSAAPINQFLDRSAAYTIYSDASGSTVAGSGTMYFASDRT